MAFRSAPPEIPVGLIKKVAITVATVIVGLVLAFGSFYSVDQGNAGIVTRFGATNRVVSPGLHFKLPVVEGVTEIGTRSQTTEWGIRDNVDYRMESYSSDRQQAHISVKVTYRVKDDAKSVAFLFDKYKDINGFRNTTLVPKTFEAVKVVFGTFNAVRVIQDRESFIRETNAKLHEMIGNNEPVFIEALQIQDIQFSPAYIQAVEERMKAEVEVAKIEQNLLREKQQAQITKTKADAEAYKVKTEGEAAAEAIRARSAALRDSPRLVELTIAEKWNGVLPSTMVPGTAVPFIGVK